MEDKRTPNFMFIPASDGKEWILNLDLVRMVDQIRTDHLRLFFSEQHTITLTGNIVPEVLSLLANNCITSTGMPLPEYMERLRSESPTPGPIPIRPRDS